MGNCSNMRVCFLIVAIVLASLGQAQIYEGSRGGSDAAQEVLDFWVQTVRGAWFGIYRGFFRGSKHAPAKCLSRNLEEEVMSVENFIFNGELQDFWTVAGSVRTVWDDNFHHCGFGDVVDTLAYKCSSNTTEIDEEGVSHTFESCSIETIVVRNLMKKHLFELIMSSLSITSTSVGWFGINATPEMIHDRMFDYGKQAGTLIADMFDVNGKKDKKGNRKFTPHKEEHYEKPKPTKKEEKVKEKKKEKPDVVVKPKKPVEKKDDFSDDDSEYEEDKIDRGGF